MKLILIRHPETVANERNLIYGHADWGYSEVGNAASLRAAAYVKKNYEKALGESTTKLFATPLSRTKILADKIAEGTNLKVEIKEDLIELNVGIFENLTVSEAKEKHESEWNIFAKQEVGYKIPEGESWVMVYERVKPFLDELAELSDETTVIVVTHAMVIRSLLAHILDIDLMKTWHFKIVPTQLIDIDLKKGFGVVNKMTDFHKK